MQTFYEVTEEAVALLSFGSDSDHLIMEILLEERSGKVFRERLLGDAMS